MRTALTSLFTIHHTEPTEDEITRREWQRLLDGATSQNERDEINFLFSSAVAA